MSPQPTSQPSPRKGLGPVTRGPKTAGSASPSTPPAATTDARPKPGVTASATPSFKFEFSLKPRDIARHLDRFVIGQSEAKKVLGVALSDHFQHVRLTNEGHHAPFYQKQNVLLLGPTGVGKTHLIRSAADLIGIPFVKADATKFSETGYVGGDVDDLVRDLVRRAGGDLRRAEHGIIYLDEIDKLATRDPGAGRDVSGRGVQINLLKLMEDAEVPLVSPNDVTGQLQQAMAAMRGNTPAAETINTRHILFIASGAFSGIDRIIRARLAAHQPALRPERMTLDQILSHVATPDFIASGLEPEFVGRLPVRVACHALDETDLFNVLRKSESSLIHQYVRAFQAYNIEVVFRDDGLRRLAQLASGERTGARGLMTACEQVFRDFKFTLPSTRVRRFEVTRELVDHPGRALRELILRSRKAAAPSAGHIDR